MIVIGFLKLLTHITEHSYIYKTPVSILTKTGEIFLNTVYFSSELPHDPGDNELIMLPFFLLLLSNFRPNLYHIACQYYYYSTLHFIFPKSNRKLTMRNLFS